MERIDSYKYPRVRWRWLLKTISYMTFGWYTLWGIFYIHMPFHCVGMMEATDTKQATHYVIYRAHPFWKANIPLYDIRIPVVMD